MKKIVLKNNTINEQSRDFLGDYLISLGIKKENIDSFKYSPKETDKDNPWDLNDINNTLEKAIIELKKNIDEDKKFFLQVDSDVDGFSSSAIFYQYFKKRFPTMNIVWNLHKGKEHGIVLETIPNDIDFIIVPDAGSMQLEEQSKINEQNKKMLILDHHTVTNKLTLENIFLINNQLGKFENKSLSGAGVTYLFIEAFDKYYFKDNLIYNNYLDLAALGIISDMMDTKTVGNNYIIYHGLRNIKNQMFQELLNKQAFSVSNVTNPNKIDVAFYIAPLINGLIRSGSQEEKEITFKAFITQNSSELIETEYRGVKRAETLYQYAARVAGNAKARQDSGKNKSFEYLKTKIENEHLNDNKVIAVVLKTEEEKKKVPQNITGLIAMEISKEYNKPTLVLREKEEDGKIKFAGSGRSKEYDGMKSFLTFIKNSGYSCYAEGHALAFGCYIEESMFDNFITYSNEILKNVDFTSETIEVDYYFKSAFLNSYMLGCFADCKDIYGNGIPQPKFAFDLDVDFAEVKIMGKDNTSYKIKKDNIDFVGFNDEETINKLKENINSKVTIIGRSQNNEWMGRKNIQIMIDSIEVEKNNTVKYTTTSLLDLI